MAEEKKIEGDGEKKATGQSKVVINSSQAYGYKYSSLADIANAGINIPQMRLKPLEGEEYIEYKDEDGQWQLGAKVVVPEMKSCNAAQAYGSAITYARRYTTQLAKGIACDDDAKIEAQPPQPKTNNNGWGKPNSMRQNSNVPQNNRPKEKIDYLFLKKVRGKLPTLNSEQELTSYWKELNLNQTYQSLLQKDFSRRKAEVNGVAR